MAIFSWNEKYSVNIREIDEQHMKLIGMVNRLDEAMLQGKGKAALGEILAALIQYARTHFSTEERLMRANGYPEYEEHKRKHDLMTEKVAHLYRDFQDGKATITFEVMKFLKDWVDKHILGTDRQYAPFLNGKGIE